MFFYFFFAAINQTPTGTLKNGVVLLGKAINLDDVILKQNIRWHARCHLRILHGIVRAVADTPWRMHNRNDFFPGLLSTIILEDVQLARLLDMAGAMTSCKEVRFFVLMKHLIQTRLLSHLNCPERWIQIFECASLRHTCDGFRP